jgi:hypothetical protein
MLRQYGPAVPEEVLRQLTGLFADLRGMVHEGALNYPYSTRELVNIVRHLQACMRGLVLAGRGHGSLCILWLLVARADMRACAVPGATGGQKSNCHWKRFISYLSYRIFLGIHSDTGPVLYEYEIPYFGRSSPLSSATWPYHQPLLAHDSGLPLCIADGTATRTGLPGRGHQQLLPQRLRL